MNIEGSLKAFIRAAERVRDDSLLDRKDTDQLGKDLISLVYQGFERGMDPYGQKWAPIAPRSGEPNYRGSNTDPLIDSANLMSSWEYGVIKSKNGLLMSLFTDVPYAPYHQEGTEKIKQRMMVPDISLGLPDDYSSAIIRAINEKLERLLGSI